MQKSDWKKKLNGKILFWDTLYRCITVFIEITGLSAHKHNVWFSFTVKTIILIKYGWYKVILGSPKLVLDNSITDYLWVVDTKDYNYLCVQRTYIVARVSGERRYYKSGHPSKRFFEYVSAILPRILPKWQVLKIKYSDWVTQFQNNFGASEYTTSRSGSDQTRSRSKK